MTTERIDGETWTLRCGYRRARFGFKGYVYWNPGWVAMNLDGVPSRKAWVGYARTERGMRRKLARRLRAERRAAERRDQWAYRGRRLGKATT